MPSICSTDCSLDYEALYGIDFYERVPVFEQRESLLLSPPPYTSSPQSGAHRHGSLQVSKVLHLSQDVIATWGQHMQLYAGQVLFLPIEVCRFLFAAQPDSFAQLTVLPYGPVTVPDSGLDALDIPSTLTYGYGNRAYFSPDGDIGQSEGARITVDANRKCYIERA